MVTGRMSPCAHAPRRIYREYYSIDIYMENIDKKLVISPIQTPTHLLFSTGFLDLKGCSVPALAHTGVCTCVSAWKLNTGMGRMVTCAYAHTWLKLNTGPGAVARTDAC